MNILLTGGTGFIGQALVRRLLREGHHVVAITRQLKTEQSHNLVWEKADVCDAGSLADVFNKHRLDGLIHGAGLVSFKHHDKHELYRCNRDGTFNVLQLAQKFDLHKVVVVSSVATMGPNLTTTPLDESASFNWNPQHHPYSDSKYQGEHIALKFAKQGMNLSVVNPAFVFGEGDDHTPAMQLILKLSKRWLPFYPPGGSCFVYVEDVVSGIVSALNKGRAGERYILGGDNVTHQQAYVFMAETLHRPPPRLPLPVTLLKLYGLISECESWLRKQAPRYSRTWAESSRYFHFYSSDKARQELNYHPIHFEELMTQTIHWLTEQGHLRA